MMNGHDNFLSALLEWEGAVIWDKNIFSHKSTTHYKWEEDYYNSLLTALDNILGVNSGTPLRFFVIP